MDDTNDNPRMIRRLGAALVLTVTAVVALASPAWAHVEIEPAEAVAGATESLTFSVAYEGSATTGLVVQLPEGASVSEVPAKAGWTSAVDEAEHTVSWTGGSAAADDTFSVVVVLPTTPGEVLFPTIQQTVAGEVAWIGEEEGEDHGSNPAPRLTLVADPDATTSTTEASTTTTEATTTTDELPGTTLEAERARRRLHVGGAVADRLGDRGGDRHRRRGHVPQAPRRPGAGRRVRRRRRRWCRQRRRRPLTTRRSSARAGA